MQPRIILEINPSELYDETELFMALRSLQVGLIGINTGLCQCVVRGEKGEPTDEIEKLLNELATKLDIVERRILLGNLSVMRK